MGEMEGIEFFDEMKGSMNTGDSGVFSGGRIAGLGLFSLGLVPFFPFLVFLVCYARYHFR